MNTNRDPREIADTILVRSPCLVQVGACIVSRKGNAISWGWNSCGASGFGEHAEASSIRRCNKRRLAGSTIYVAGMWRRGKLVTSKPCPACARLIAKWGLRVVYRDCLGRWN